MAPPRSSMLWEIRYLAPFHFEAIPSYIYANFRSQTVVEKKKKLTSSELRKKRKERLARKKRGEDVSDDEDF